MKVLALCNSRLGFPAIEFLFSTGMLAACITPETLNEEIEELHHVCNQQNIAWHTVSKNALVYQLKERIAQYKPDAVFVFTFPFKIPEELLTLPPKGFINFHYGLLPEYRGSNPIFWEIKNRETHGGISVHLMTKDLDKGPVFVKHLVPIQPDDSYGRHLNEVAYAGPQAITELLKKLTSQVPPIPQPESKAKYYKRPSFADVCINWTTSAAEIVALVNACNPWNRGAIASIHHLPLRIIAVTSQVRKPGDFAIGEVICADNVNGLCIACGKNEQIRADICMINNEFIATPNIHLTGIQAGFMFDNQQDVLQR